MWLSPRFQPHTGGNGISLVSGSLALLADAGHTLTNAGALAWLGFRMARRRHDNDGSFGYTQFKVLAGLFRALTLLATTIGSPMKRFSALCAPQPVLAWPMLLWLLSHCS